MSQPDSPRQPQVTVGVPVFNGERFLARTLEALRDQGFDEVEILVADNGSTDRSRAIAESFASSDSRFRVLRSDVNRGLPWNYNRLVAEARAPLFMWNASDDVILPGHLAACVKALAEHPEATVAFSRVALVDRDDQVVGTMDDEGLDFLGGSPAERLDLFLARRAWQAIGFGGVIRTDVLREMGGMGSFYGPDVALGAKMALRSPWVQVPTRHYTSRRHDAQTNKLQGSDPVEQVRVFVPEYRRRVAFPQWYLNHRLLVEAVSAPVSPRERVRALVAVIRRWTIPNWRFFPFDVKRNIIRIVRGRYVGAYHS